MKFKKALIIYNPVSGWFPSKAHIFDLINKLSKDNIISEVLMTQKDQNLNEILKDISKKDISRIICCGGDGTLHEVINAILKNNIDIPLSYLPIGTTNDFGNTHGIPHDFNKALDIIEKNDIRTLDVGLFDNEEFFTYIACFGIFTKLTYEASQPLKNSIGQLAYFLEGTKELGDFSKAYRMRVETDDRVYEGDFIFGGVVNSMTVGGFLTVPVTLDELADGLLEVILVRLPENFMELQNLAGSVITTGFNNDNVILFKTKKVKFISDKPVAWNLDGEYAGKKRALTIEVKEKGLKITL